MKNEGLTRRGLLSLGAISAAALAGTGLAGCAQPKPASERVDKIETINCSGIVVDPSQVTETIKADIVVLGGGMSGLSAAVQAAENGDDVILLEAQSALGGNGQGVEGTLGVGTKWQQEKGIDVDCAVIMQEELGKAQWVPNGLFYKDLVDRSAANLEWAVETCGCELSGLIDNYPMGVVKGAVDTFHWWKDGAAYVGYIQPMEKHLRKLGASIDLNTRALEFSYADDGSVDGVYALDAFGDLVKYQAKAVIVATGGFANDDERLKKYGFDLDTLERIGTPGHYGDGINMVLAAGAREYTGVCYLKYNRIGHSKIAPFGPFWSAMCFGGPFLWVNEDCERFVDEGCMYRVGNIITQSTPMHAQPHCTCLSIFDQEVFDAQLQENAELAEEWGVDIAAEWKEIVDGKDDAFQANSIEELAEQAGIEVQALKKVVDEYNAMCEAGRDNVFGKDAKFLKPIKTAPFYLARIHEVMEGPLGGVTIDRTFRPVLNDGGRLENVFVIGLDSMMLYRDVYPIDVPGSASAECINGGRTAANQAHELL